MTLIPAKAALQRSAVFVLPLPGWLVSFAGVGRIPDAPMPSEIPSRTTLTGGLIESPSGPVPWRIVACESIKKHPRRVLFLYIVYSNASIRSKISSSVFDEVMISQSFLACASFASVPLTLDITWSSFSCIANVIPLSVQVFNKLLRSLQVQFSLIGMCQPPCSANASPFREERANPCPPVDGTGFACDIHIHYNPMDAYDQPPRRILSLCGVRCVTIFASPEIRVEGLARSGADGNAPAISRDEGRARRRCGKL